MADKDLLNKIGKLDIKKQQKRESLLNTAFELFTTKGLHSTSISDIVEKAGVAKGTFYLYFKDKYDINQKLIAHKSAQLFDRAMENLNNHPEIEDLSDKIIFLINDILDSLSDNKTLLYFIAKDLGLGFYRSAINTDNFDESPFHAVYQELLSKHGDSIKDPEIMIYMIIELVGSSCYTAILYEEPMSMQKLKPYLFHTIQDIIDDFMVNEKDRKNHVS